MAVSDFWLSLLSRLGLADRDGHCYWFFTGIDRRGQAAFGVSLTLLSA
ncbi:hypothetical protein [Bifidobacterium moukalabense]|nr:hypothetical protein [Bifidobacterium moukalabense]